MINAAVFPVPFFARAKISRPVRATGIVSSWIGEGFSKPASNMPIMSSRLMKKSSKSSPFVAVTSSVCCRESLGRETRPSFQFAPGVAGVTGEGFSLSLVLASCFVMSDGDVIVEMGAGRWVDRESEGIPKD